MHYFQKKYGGILKRIKCASLGIFYFKNSDFQIKNNLKINGKYKVFNFINLKSTPFVHEFNEICLNDCYQIKLLSKHIQNINVIVDVGTNQGLFTIAARQQFPNAKISCYEPNWKLENILSQNAKNLDAVVYYEAITKDDCRVLLEFGDTDLLTKTKHSCEGEIIGTSLKKVIERCGGKIDLLKLDCEGAEWELFEDESSWQNIRGLTMEYHLWAKEGSTFNSIQLTLQKLNFNILFNKKVSNSFGLITAVKK